MEPLTALAIFNSIVQAAALAYDAYQKSGASPEEVIAARDAAFARFDITAAAVAVSMPPEVQQP